MELKDLLNQVDRRVDKLASEYDQTALRQIDEDEELMLMTLEYAIRFVASCHELNPAAFRRQIINYSKEDPVKLRYAYLNLERKSAYKTI